MNQVILLVISEQIKFYSIFVLSSYPLNTYFLIIILIY